MGRPAPPRARPRGVRRQPASGAADRGEATLKTDKVDAETLARLVRLDPKFLSPITHRSVESRQQRATLRVRAVLVETRSKMISVVRGLVKQFGKRLPSCTADTFVERFRVFSRSSTPWSSLR